jgi:hypothetical protein
MSRSNIELTREYLQHRGTGSGMPRCAKNENRTHTLSTRFGNTVGLPTPVFNPKCNIVVSYMHEVNNVYD